MGKNGVTQRNLGLDVIKIIASIGVVILHVTGIKVVSGGYTYVNAIYYLGTVSIPLFFMVNGYLLLNKKNITYKYVAKKILHLLLIGFICCLAMNTVTYMAGGLFANPFITLADSLIQRGKYGLLWYLGALCILYLFLPLLHYAFGKRDESKGISIAMLLTGVLLLLMLCVDTVNIQLALQRQAIIDKRVIQTFRLWIWLFYFCLGGLLGRKETFAKLTSMVPVPVNIVAVVTLLIGVNIYENYFALNIYHIPAGAEFYYSNILVVLLVACIFLLCSRLEYPSVIQRMITVVSKDMLGIYLIHNWIIKLLLLAWDLKRGIYSMAAVVVVYIISVAISELLRRLPLIRKLI